MTASDVREGLEAGLRAGAPRMVLDRIEAMERPEEFRDLHLRALIKSSGGIVQARTLMQHRDAAQIYAPLTRGLFWHAARDYGQAEEAYLSADPNDAEVKFLLGTLYLHQRKPADARRSFEAAIELEDVSPRNWIGLMRASLEEAELEPTIDVYRRFVAKHERSAALASSWEVEAVLSELRSKLERPRQPVRNAAKETTQ